MEGFATREQIAKMLVPTEQNVLDGAFRVVVARAAIEMAGIDEAPREVIEYLERQYKTVQDILKAVVVDYDPLGTVSHGLSVYQDAKEHVLGATSR